MTEEQVRIVNLVARNNYYAEVAEHCGVSVATVKKATAAARRELGCGPGIANLWNALRYAGLLLPNP